ncbi:galactosylceramide sulfotransferase-like [Antedon mediterranea]|uniref:galactosylceramide sulfotransferase-like n=1 Tax=Antedon mediterranea TaxID=105859 RepID=UPI003AF91423
MSDPNVITSNRPLGDYHANLESHKIDFWRTFGNVSSCLPKKKNVCYIKTHKTGSTTIGHIMNIFGFRHNLSFAFNKNKTTNGHIGSFTVLNKDTPRHSFLPPLGVEEGDYDNYKYNLTSVHFRYIRTGLISFMNPDTKYITIIRELAGQFESAFDQFQLKRALVRNKTESDYENIKRFLQYPDHYWENLRKVKWRGNSGRAWYYARNNQLFDLGLDHKYHGDTQLVERYLDLLNNEFEMVIILEHIGESLVVLRKELCWSWNDVLYIAKNGRENVTALPNKLQEKIRAWNFADRMLYSYFNKTLWQKVQRYGSTCESDLALFRKLRQQVNDVCEVKTHIRNNKVFHNQAKGASLECELLGMRKNRMFKKVFLRQGGDKATEQIDEKDFDPFF